MSRFSTLAAAATLVKVALAGTTIWSGSFDSYPTSESFDTWSWANEVGEYQWYIHGSGATSEYLAVDPSYKNPASSEAQGLRVTLDATSLWNGQTMERTELIPQTSANLGTGNLLYHFSMKRDSTNPPEFTAEHQMVFFESHFTEFKTGVAPNTTYLEWHVGGVPQWGVPWDADTWYNFAYDIDFSGSTVGLWASTGSDPLVKVHPNIGASTSTNSEDWHLGVLRLLMDSAVEHYYFSGVYIEQAPITTSVGTGGSSGSGSTTGAAAPTTAAPTSAKPTTSVSATTSAAGPVQTKYGQCGGTGWTGPTTCASGSTCTAVSAPYYSQCL
ncbi:unnamed protein product [Peniophora sp. CBMAI 1063]|nr:unnamed protein product [Peniophora sp. CBMAI 1063]